MTKRKVGKERKTERKQIMTKKNGICGGWWQRAEEEFSCCSDKQ